MGEHATVEWPGRGAPFCRARRAAAPVRPFFSRAGQGPVRVGFFSLPFLIPLFLFDLVLLSSELMWGMGLGLGFLFFLGFDSDWDEGVSLSVFF